MRLRQRPGREARQAGPPDRQGSTAPRALGLPRQCRLGHPMHSLTFVSQTGRTKLDFGAPVGHVRGSDVQE